MDTFTRVALANRQSPQAIGNVLRISLRQAADARIDVPEVQESTRVTFTPGAAVAESRASRSPVDLYRWIQSL